MFRPPCKGSAPKPRTYVRGTGFTSEEVAQASHQGFLTIRLGERVLMTETAAMGAFSVVQFLWGDMR
ncbi:MAG: 16S rRNA (uracil(1498)-N(3))-methyltransferase [Deltaproteobacteria bacterium]|nr:16S rRNA (uracil(1498)-N(3))-methyltransferase [Deltaproteobacteria bacterium]